MRLIVLLFATVFIATTPVAKAQDTLQAGVQMAYAQTSVIAHNVFEDENPDNLGGLEIGIFTLFEIDESFALRPGLAFSQKGFQVDYGDEQFQTRFNYLKVPVTGRLNFPLGKATVFANVGPYFGWLLSARESGVRPNPSGLEDASGFIDAEADVTRNYKYGDIGVRGGVGVMYPFWEGSVTLEVNYEEGFVNIDNEQPEARSVQNKGYQIAVGYMTTFH